MTAGGAASGGSDSSVASYEKLRRQVVAGTSVGGHAGRFLLQREGVVCWLLRRATAPVAPPKEPAPHAAVLDQLDALQKGVVQVMADLACHGLRGASS
jgi:hypothetical protein